MYGEKIFQQICGIGMGNEMSPPASTLALAYAERRFVLSLQEAIGTQRILDEYHGFRFVTRYIDDRHNAKGTVMPAAIDYAGMVLVRVGCSDDISGVKTLGIRVTFSSPLSSNVFALEDKQLAFNFPILRYPTAFTAIRRCVQLGCVIGMLKTAGQFSSNESVFIECLETKFDVLRSRGFHPSIVRQAAMRFL